MIRAHESTSFNMYSERCLNWTLNKPKTCLNQTDFTVPPTKCLCNLNLCKPNTCLNWANSSVPKRFCLDRFYCTRLLCMSLNMDKIYMLGVLVKRVWRYQRPKVKGTKGQTTICRQNHHFVHCLLFYLYESCKWKLEFVF